MGCFFLIAATYHSKEGKTPCFTQTLAADGLEVAQSVHGPTPFLFPVHPCPRLQQLSYPACILTFSPSSDAGLVEGVHAWVSGLGTRWALISLPAQTVLWSYDSVLHKAVPDTEIREQDSLLLNRHRLLWAAVWCCLTHIDYMSYQAPEAPGHGPVCHIILVSINPFGNLAQVWSAER